MKNRLYFIERLISKTTLIVKDLFDKNANFRLGLPNGWKQSVTLTRYEHDWAQTVCNINRFLTSAKCYSDIVHGTSCRPILPGQQLSITSAMNLSDAEVFIES